MIPQHTIQDIRDRAADDIVEIISDFVHLKRSGNSYKAKCPFHDENTASFSVSSERGIYKCFGCGEGGDAIDFLMKHEGMDFMDVIKHLARRYMIDISDGSRSQPRNRGKTKKEIYESVLPGIGAAKNCIRKQDAVLIFVTTGPNQKKVNPTHAELTTAPPVSRGQFTIINKYTSNVVLHVSECSKEQLLESIRNGLKTGISIKVLNESGQKTDWLIYIMQRYPHTDELKSQLKRIIAQIPDNLTYRIYQQEYIKQLNLTDEN